jgi:hypothetical protein
MEQESLYSNIFNKSDSDWDNKSFLKNTVEQFPYFGLAHFYLLKSTGTYENSYAEVASKSALYFESPFLLQSQLHKKDIEELKGNDDKQESDLVIKPLATELESVKTENVVQIAETRLAAENVPQTVALVEKEEMIFEPLFASDYFASQGIKLSEIVEADDKLGKQLKSFTSWLKTMKKVHPDKLPMVNELVEAVVQKQAAKSNLEEEVLTEAMAEAFEAQGKEIRAIEVYEKLSLLNPTKSAYFAAKIDQLKK